MVKKTKANKGDDSKLSTTELKHTAFVLEFLVDLNATRAYKKVYNVSQKVAEAAGPRLLGNVRVGEMIKRGLSKRFEKAELNGQWVIDRLKELVDRCMQQTRVMYYDKVEKEYVQRTEEVLNDVT